MEIISAFIGAIIGAIVSFALAEFSRTRSERKKVIAAIKSELRLNIDVAEKIIEANKNFFEETDSRKWGYCEIIPMSDSAWVAMLSTGSISHLKQNSIESLSSAYGKVRSVNFVAEKIKAGRYESREGMEYNNRVKQALEALKHAKISLEK